VDLRGCVKEGTEGADDGCMAGISKSPHPDIVRFAEAEAKLREAKVEATRGFEAAQRSGDLETARGWYEKLTMAGEEFAAFRASFSPEALLRINGNRILESVTETNRGLTFISWKQPFLNFTIPAGVSDVDALRAVDFVRLETREGSLLRDAEYEFIAQKGWDRERNTAQPRVVSIVIPVERTSGKDRATQDRILKREGLELASPIEQLLGVLVDRTRPSSSMPERYKTTFRGSDPDLVLQGGSLFLKFITPDLSNPPPIGVKRQR
jgi:hypothetical protein